MKMRNKYILVFFISMILLSACESSKKEPDFRSKIVKEKTESRKGHYLVAFTDGSDVSVTYGLYVNIEENDTMVFKCTEGLTFNKWNCNYVNIKPKKDE